MNTIPTFIPLQVFDLPEGSSTEDPAKNYLASQLNYKPASSWSDTSDHKMLRYNKASRNVHNYVNAVYVVDYASVQNECAYVIRILRENAVNDTMIGTTSFNVIVPREGSVISPLRANLHTALFDSSAGQYYGATGAVSPHLNESADRVNEPPVYEIINRLFSIEPMPDFEDGVSNAFSEGIDYVVREFGNDGVGALEENLVATDDVSCVAEALRTLGLVDDVTTAERRFQTLVMLLKHRSPIVRDAAAIGLAYLDDQRAIPAINEAIETEPLSFLRSDMEAIRDQLAHR